MISTCEAMKKGLWLTPIRVKRSWCKIRTERNHSITSYQTWIASERHYKWVDRTWLYLNIWPMRKFYMKLLWVGLPHLYSVSLGNPKSIWWSPPDNEYIWILTKSNLYFLSDIVFMYSKICHVFTCPILNTNVGLRLYIQQQRKALVWAVKACRYPISSPNKVDNAFCIMDRKDCAHQLGS